jgi:hypothetical protein
MITLSDAVSWADQVEDNLNDNLLNNFEDFSTPASEIFDDLNRFKLRAALVTYYVSRSFHKEIR